MEVFRVPAYKDGTLSVYGKDLARLLPRAEGKKGELNDTIIMALLWYVLSLPSCVGRPVSWSCRAWHAQRPKWQSKECDEVAILDSQLSDSILDIGGYGAFTSSMV